MILFIVFFHFSFVGIAQTEQKDRICFHFIDQYGSSVSPTVEIIDSEGDLFKLSTDYCFDYFTSNHVFCIRVNANNYYEYNKMYRTPAPKIDTIFLENIRHSIHFSIKSDTSTLADEDMKYLQDLFSNKRTFFSSLSLEINVGKYDESEFKHTIEQIYAMFLSKTLEYKNFHELINFSISFKNEDLENVLYYFTCN